MTRLRGSLLACLLAAACGTSTPSAPSGGSTQPTNRPPVVNLAIQGASSCVPIPPLDGMPGRPCGIPVIAQASDPDGDALTYKWTGCTTFGFPPNESTCYVTQVGPVTSTVEVSDGRGKVSTASIAAEGVNPPPGFVNHPPSVSFGYFDLPKAPARSIEALGSIGDPDEGDLCGGGSGGVGGCPWLKDVRVSGDCDRDRYAVLGCYCLEGLTVDIYRAKSSGTCSLTLTVRDSWGMASTATFSVPYSASGSVTAVPASVVPDFSRRH